MSAAPTQVNLALRLLDDQLIDADEHRCGRVDDVELQGAPGERTEVSALLVGPGAWPDRLRRPFSTALSGITAGYMHCVPWDAVGEVSTAVRLSRPAAELALGAHEGRGVRWVDAPPRGTIRLSELLRARLITGEGLDIGRVWEVRAERGTAVPDERVHERWLITGLLFGAWGLRERLGVSAEADPGGRRGFVPWDRVVELRPGSVQVTGADRR